MRQIVVTALRALVLFIEPIVNDTCALFGQGVRAPELNELGKRILVKGRAGWGHESFSEAEA